MRVCFRLEVNMKLKIQHTIEQKEGLLKQNGTHEPIVFSIDISLAEEHNIVGLFGPSGAGKSTILKILAGLNPHANWTMLWGNSEYNNHKGYQNPCVYVGEDSTLFSHLNLLDNLKLVQNLSSTQTHSPFSLDDLILLCNLSQLLQKMPWQLSSGEKQRACFARALLSGKKILLLDEAFSALDWTKRIAFNRLLCDVVEQYGYLVIMVSHSLRELSLCATQLITIDSSQVIEQASLRDALSQKLASNEEDHKQYFSALPAVFSHTDKQDPALQIWTLVETPNKELDDIKPITFYVKDSLTLSLPEGTKIKSSGVAARPKTQTFIVDANKVSISKNADNQTSMVNCLPVKVKEILHIDAGVLVSSLVVSDGLICEEGQAQTLRSIITTKSLLQLNIQCDDIVYFVFKAL